MNNLSKLDLITLDKDLSEEQRQEWNSIYASFRAGSILTGKVVGMDTNTITVKKNGRDESVIVHSLVVIAYRVKVLIPESEIWYDENSKRPPYVLRSMTGTTIDYVITDIDREGECAVASRRKALEVKRRSFAKTKPKPGDKISCRVSAVGRTHLLAEAGGYDMTLSQRDLSYGMLSDLRQDYRPGHDLISVIKEFDSKSGKLSISVKEAEPHPFDGADIRHPIGSRRASKITGKYGGGVFCRLDKNLDCMCVYSANQQDTDFRVDDEVIVVITRCNYEKKQIYGKIVAKW